MFFVFLSHVQNLAKSILSKKVLKCTLIRLSLKSCMFQATQLMTVMPVFLSVPTLTFLKIHYSNYLWEQTRSFPIRRQCNAFKLLGSFTFDQ